MCHIRGKYEKKWSSISKVVRQKFFMIVPL